MHIGWQIWRPDHWPSRLESVRVLLLLGLLAGVLISWKAWLTERAFPHFPLFAPFGPLPTPWDRVLLGFYLLVLVAAILRPGCRWALASLLGLSVLLALQDQVRWQPWFYLYLLSLAGFLFLPGRGWEGTGMAVLGLLRILLVAMYFWSGYHKLHPAFDTMYPQAFLTPLQGVWPDWAVQLLESLQRTAPWVEMGTALLLLLPVPLLRHAGVFLAVSTHLLILLILGPLGMSSNEVIWPWNLCMMAIVPLCFWNIPFFGWRELAVTPVRFWALPLFVLVGLLPALSPGRWDRYLSFHLYSGRDQRVLLVLDDRAAAALPEELQPFLARSASGRLNELRFKQWALQELKVPFPSEERLNLALARQLADVPFPSGSTVFFYFDYEFELQDRGWSRFSPGEIRHLEHFGEPRLPYQPPQ